MLSRRHISKKNKRKLSHPPHSPNSKVITLPCFYTTKHLYRTYDIPSNCQDRSKGWERRRLAILNHYVEYDEKTLGCKLSLFNYIDNPNRTKGPAQVRLQYKNVSVSKTRQAAGQDDDGPPSQNRVSCCTQELISIPKGLEASVIRKLVSVHKERLRSEGLLIGRVKVTSMEVAQLRIPALCFELSASGAQSKRSIPVFVTEALNYSLTDNIEDDSAESEDEPERNEALFTSTQPKSSSSSVPVTTIHDQHRTFLHNSRSLHQGDQESSDVDELDTDDDMAESQDQPRYITVTNVPALNQVNPGIQIPPQNRHQEQVPTSGAPIVSRNSHFSLYMSHRDRARRLLMHKKDLVCVSSQGNLNFSNAQRQCIRELYTSEDRPCIVSDAATIGQDQEHIILTYARHPTIKNTPRACLVTVSEGKTKRADIKLEGTPTGLNCVCPIPSYPNHFVTGGDDKAICVWKLSSCRESLPRASKVAYNTTSSVSCVSYVAHSEKLLSGGLKNFWMHDRTRPRDKPLLKQTLDNFILQLHVLPQEPNVVIMELERSESCMGVYDLRDKFTKPSIRFGKYQRREGKAASGSKYMKGVYFENHYFARGDTNGFARLWDIRYSTNLRSVKIGSDVKTIKNPSPDEAISPISHMIWDGSHLLAASHHRVSYIAQDEWA